MNAQGLSGALVVIKMKTIQVQFWNAVQKVVSAVCVNIVFVIPVLAGNQSIRKPWKTCVNLVREAELMVRLFVDAQSFMMNICANLQQTLQTSVHSALIVSQPWYSACAHVYAIWSVVCLVVILFIAHNVSLCVSPLFALVVFNYYAIDMAEHSVCVFGFQRAWNFLYLGLVAVRCLGIGLYLKIPSPTKMESSLKIRSTRPFRRGGSKEAGVNTQRLRKQVIVVDSSVLVAVVVMQTMDLTHETWEKKSLFTCEITIGRFTNASLRFSSSSFCSLEHFMS